MGTASTVTLLLAMLNIWIPSFLLVKARVSQVKLFSNHFNHYDDPHSASDRELRTTGPAGEWQGNVMGVYQLHSEEEGTGRVYKQRHGDGDTQYYLYRSFMFNLIIYQCIALHCNAEMNTTKPVQQSNVAEHKI